MTSGYRCVNYFELCRLCTSSAGTKTNIFSDEGRKIDLIGKIAVCLPVVIDEQDKLPKILCATCLNQVESIAKFRETCINAQTMLESCLNSAKLRNGGKVYIKDISSKKQNVGPAGSAVALRNIKTIGATTIRPAQPRAKTYTTNATTTTSSDFLSNIIQAVGIHNTDDSELQQMPQLVQQQPQQQQQYTITLDGQSVRTNQIHYKIEPASQTLTLQPGQTITTNNCSSVDEFLKLKPNNQITIKKKVIGNRTAAATTTRLKSNAVATNSFPSDVRIITQNKCYVPITIKDENSDQQIVAQIDANDLVLPGGFLKLQTTGTNKNHQLLTTTNYSTQNFVGHLDSKSVFTTASGHNVTIHQPLTTMSNSTMQQQHQQHQSNLVQQQLMPPPPQPMQIIQIQPMTQLDNNSSNFGQNSVQLTTLQNVKAPQIPHPLPAKSGVTIQRLKTDTNKQSAVAARPTAPSKSAPSAAASPKALPTLQSIKSPGGGSGFKAKTKPALVKGVTGSTKSTVAHSASKPLLKKIPPKTVTATAAAAAVVTTPPANGNPDDLPSCSVCEKVFKRKEHLNQHMKLHLGLRPFCCDEAGCNKSFSRKEHLMRHVVSHTGKKMFSCEFCQKLFSRKDNLNKHKRSHESKQSSKILYTITQVKDEV